MNNKSITVFGEVLFDHFPDGSTILGGASFNVAWHLQAFGQSPDFISRVGCDLEGKQIQSAMQSWGMTTHHLQQDLTYPTGQVKVSFYNGEPTYAIVANQAYDFIAATNLDKVNREGILYHGTLAVRSETAKRTLTRIKSCHQGKRFIDINLRQPWWNTIDVAQLIADAGWLKLNLHEVHALENKKIDSRAFMELYLTRYALDGIVVTCGESGASAMTRNGNFYSVMPKPSVALVDTVGAGDAFSSVILLGINLNWNFELTMKRAQDFASAITRQPGAIVDDVNFYKPFLKEWAIENTI